MRRLLEQVSGEPLQRLTLGFMGQNLNQEEKKDSIFVTKEVNVHKKEPEKGGKGES